MFCVSAHTVFCREHILCKSSVAQGQDQSPGADQGKGPAGFVLFHRPGTGDEGKWRQYCTLFRLSLLPMLYPLLDMNKRNEISSSKIKMLPVMKTSFRSRLSKEIETNTNEVWIYKSPSRLSSEVQPFDSQSVNTITVPKLPFSNDKKNSFFRRLLFNNMRKMASTNSSIESGCEEVDSCITSALKLSDENNVDKNNVNRFTEKPENDTEKFKKSDSTDELYSKQNRWGVEEYERQTPLQLAVCVGEHKSIMKMPCRTHSTGNEATLLQQSEISTDLYLEQSGYNESPTHTLSSSEKELP